MTQVISSATKQKSPFGDFVCAADGFGHGYSIAVAQEFLDPGSSVLIAIKT